LQIESIAELARCSICAPDASESAFTGDARISALYKHFASVSRQKTLGTGGVPAKISGPDPQRSLLTIPAA